MWLSSRKPWDCLIVWSKRRSLTRAGQQITVGGPGAKQSLVLWLVRGAQMGEHSGWEGGDMGLEICKSNIFREDHAFTALCKRNHLDHQKNETFAVIRKEWVGIRCQGGAEQFSFAFALSRYSATERPGNLIRGQIMNQVVPEKGGNISPILFRWALSILCCSVRSVFSLTQLFYLKALTFQIFNFCGLVSFLQPLALKWGGEPVYL